MKRVISLLLMIICLLTPLTAFARQASTRLQMSYTPSGEYASSVYHSRLTELVQTGNQRLDLINAALSQVGYHEGNTEEDLDGENYAGNLNVTEYGRWFGLEVLDRDTGFYYEWCAMFVAWCARQAGIPVSIINNSAYAHVGGNPYYFNMSFQPRGSYLPKTGDLIIYDWAYSSKEWDHVGIVTFVENGYVHAVEGNFSNKVLTRVIALDDSEIQGYGTPAYTNADASAVLAANYPVPTRTLNYGDTGEDVKWLQAALLHLGYASPIDGKFGRNTLRVLKKFQDAHGLTADGICGKKTRKMVKKYLEQVTAPADPSDPSNYPFPTRTLKYGSQGNDVRWVQAVLKRLGFAAAIDGDFGSVTKKAVKAFQKKYGLTADGKVGSATREKLKQEYEHPTPQTNPSQPPTDIGYPVPTRNLKKGMRGEDVKWVQEVLRRLGYTIVVDGIFGSETDYRVRHFQKSNSLAQDGVVGPVTRAAMQASIQ